jgi:mannose-6-phosphate isomerase-like protein (cupin superfamily)
MMKNGFLLLATLLAFALPAAAQERPAPPTKLFASAAEVEGLIAKARAEHKGGNTVEIIASVGPYPVQLEFRTATTPPSVHKQQAELIYVVGGGCTLVTGGTLLNPKDNGANLSGTAIQGGVPQKVAKGDYILVPPNTPHWYTDVQGEFISATLHMPMKPD